MKFISGLGQNAVLAENITAFAACSPQVLSSGDSECLTTHRFVRPWLVLWYCAVGLLGLHASTSRAYEPTLEFAEERFELSVFALRTRLEERITQLALEDDLLKRFHKWLDDHSVGGQIPVSVELHADSRFFAGTKEPPTFQLYDRNLLVPWPYALATAMGLGETQVSYVALGTEMDAADATRFMPSVSIVAQFTPANRSEHPTIPIFRVEIVSPRSFPLDDLLPEKPEDRRSRIGKLLQNEHMLTYVRDAWSQQDRTRCLDKQLLRAVRQEFQSGADVTHVSSLIRNQLRAALRKIAVRLLEEANDATSDIGRGIKATNDAEDRIYAFVGDAGVTLRSTLTPRGQRAGDATLQASLSQAVLSYESQVPLRLPKRAMYFVHPWVDEPAFRSVVKRGEWATSVYRLLGEVESVITRQPNQDSETASRSRSNLRVAFLYIALGNVRRGVAICETAADCNSNAAQVYLGRFYEDGLVDGIQQLEKARKCYETAADKGSMDGQVCLSLMTLKCGSSQVEKQRAFEALSVAAHGGHPVAQATIGKLRVLWEKLIGMPLPNDDDDASVRWTPSAKLSTPVGTRIRRSYARACEDMATLVPPPTCFCRASALRYLALAIDEQVSAKVGSGAKDEGGATRFIAIAKSEVNKPWKNALLANLMSELGDYAAAKEALRNAGAPEGVLDALDVANAYVNVGEFELAVATLKSAQASFDPAWTKYFASAIALFGDRASAMQMCRDVLAQNSFNSIIVARLQALTGNVAEARETLINVTVQCNRMESVTAQCSWYPAIIESQIVIGDLVGANGTLKDLLNVVQTRTQETSSTRVYSDLAGVYFALGDTEAAKSWMKKTVDKWLEELTDEVSLLSTEYFKIVTTAHAVGDKTSVHTVLQKAREHADRAGGAHFVRWHELTAILHLYWLTESYEEASSVSKELMRDIRASGLFSDSAKIELRAKMESDKEKFNFESPFHKLTSIAIGCCNELDDYIELHELLFRRPRVQGQIPYGERDELGHNAYWHDRLMASFRCVDGNSDGQLTATEVGLAGLSAEFVLRRDQDLNGRVSKGEFIRFCEVGFGNSHQRLLDEIDRNTIGWRLDKYWRAISERR